MLEQDQWLSLYFKGGAYRYHQSNEKSYQTLQEGFVYTKVPSSAQESIHDLIQDGFKLIEVAIFLEQKYPLWCDKNDFSLSTVNVGFVQPTEKEQVAEIARNAFMGSRFYRDDRIPKAIAAQIKEHWVDNYFLGQRGDNMIVARLDGRVIGFLLLVQKTVIDLIAVSPDYFRRSIASAMLMFANENIGLLQAGTQLDNQASVAMYTKHGFFLKQAHYVLHKFIG